MGVNVSVETKKLDALQSSIAENVNKIHTAFDKIDQLYTKINQYWESEAWSEAYDTYIKQKPDIATLETQLREYPYMLGSITTSYGDVEAKIKTQAEVLPGSIIK